jgi:hypothetical protein
MGLSLINMLGNYQVCISHDMTALPFTKFESVLLVQALESTSHLSYLANTTAAA